jgi:hypothetical protein
VLGPDAIASSIVTKYLHKGRFPSILVDLPEEPPTTIIDQAILDAIKKQAFLSSGAR